MGPREWNGGTALGQMRVTALGQMQSGRLRGGGLRGRAPLAYARGRPLASTSYECLTCKKKSLSAFVCVWMCTCVSVRACVCVRSHLETVFNWFDRMLRILGSFGSYRSPSLSTATACLS